MLVLQVQKGFSNGDKCRFAHDEKSPIKKIKKRCWFHHTSVGCKYGINCFFQHEEKEISTCPFGVRCRFQGRCFYDHTLDWIPKKKRGTDLLSLQKRYERVYRQKCKISKCDEDKQAKSAVEIVVKAIAMPSAPVWVTIIEHLRDNIVKLLKDEGINDPLKQAQSICYKVVMGDDDTFHPMLFFIVICQIELMLEKNNQWRQIIQEGV